MAAAVALAPLALLTDLDRDARASSAKTVWAVGDGADGGTATGRTLDAGRLTCSAR